MSIDTQCEMKATEYGVLTKTTSTATIDCELTDAFQNVHADKTWTVMPKYTAHVLVGMGTAKAAATTMSVDGTVKPGAILKVVQSPKSPTRVQFASSIGGGLAFGAIMVAGGALLTLWGFVRRSRKQKVVAILQELAAKQRAEAAAGVTPSPVEQPVAAAAPVEARAARPAYVLPPSPIQNARRSFGRR